MDGGQYADTFNRRRFSIQINMEKQPIVTSPKGKLDWRDFSKGLLMAVGTGVATAALDSIQAEQVVLHWAKLGWVALAAAITYLLKNLLSPSMVKTPAE